MNKQMTKGISLIVLVITVIVMIILAGTIILTITNNGIIDKSEEAVEKANLKQIEQIATLGWTEAFLKETTETKNDAYYQTAVVNYLKSSGVTETELNKYTITATESGVAVALTQTPGENEGTPSVREGYLSGTWRFNDELNIEEEGVSEEIEFAFLKNDVRVYCNVMAFRYEGGPILHYYISAVESSNAGIEPPETWTACSPYGWNSFYLEADLQTITFTSEQEVSTEFWTWFTSNATQVIEVQELPTANINTNVIYKTYEYLDIDNTNSTTLAAGTYRFNDTLTIPTTETSASFDFTVPSYEVELTQELVDAINNYYGISLPVGVYTVSYSYNGMSWWYLDFDVFDVNEPFLDFDGQTVSVEPYYSEIVEFLSGSATEMYHPSTGWTSEIGEDIQTIIITTAQEVPTEFWNWFATNAKLRVEKYYQYINGTWIEHN